MGDFVYKTNRYEYISRYQIGFKDRWGFAELLITPAPCNVSLLLILPFVFQKPMFKRVSTIIAKLWFWIENILLVSAFFIYEILVIPIVFIKVLWTVFSIFPFM